MKKDIPVWENIGSLLGLSFQIQDDVLDVTADETELGKTSTVMQITIKQLMLHF